MCILEAGKNQEEMSSESFCGTIKSFNSRRGFGFVSCEETALRFGRDVYLSKDEAMILAAEPAVGLAATNMTAMAGNDQKAPPVQEDDFLLFQVKLSTEGFPQAVRARKIRRLRGFVQQAPSSTTDGIIIVDGDGDERAEGNLHAPDAALKELLGAEVRLRQAECGQLKLQANDEIAFCCANTTDSDAKGLEAQLVELLSTSRSNESVLGCFSLKLPQLVNRHAADGADHEDGAATTGASSLELYGHAFADRVCLSEVPVDLSAPTLMRFFSKLGGKEAVVTPGHGHATGCASISFSGPEQVAKFLVRATHTISESGITELAHVGPCPESKATLGSIGSDLKPGRMQYKDLNPAELQYEDGQPLLSNYMGMESSVQLTHGPSTVLDAGNRLPEANAAFSQPSPAPQVQQTGNCTCSPAMPMMATTYTAPDWRCIHNNIIVPTAAPEMLVTSDNCCSVCIQWPTVIHASAYVIDLLNQSTMTTQRFVRVMSEGVLPALVDLRLDGLQPCAYAASVRCQAPCGCESSCSPWTFMTLSPVAPAPCETVSFGSFGPATAPGAAPPLCPPPPSAPPSLPLVTMPVKTLPPITEEAMDGIATCDDDILTLD